MALYTLHQFDSHARILCKDIFSGLIKMQPFQIEKLLENIDW